MSRRYTQEVVVYDPYAPTRRQSQALVVPAARRYERTYSEASTRSSDSNASSSRRYSTYYQQPPSTVVCYDTYDNNDRTSRSLSRTRSVSRVRSQSRGRQNSFYNGNADLPPSTLNGGMRSRSVSRPRPRSSMGRRQSIKCYDEDVPIPRRERKATVGDTLSLIVDTLKGAITGRRQV